SPDEFRGCDVDRSNVLSMFSLSLRAIRAFHSHLTGEAKPFSRPATRSHQQRPRSAHKGQELLNIQYKERVPGGDIWEVPIPGSARHASERLSAGEALDDPIREGQCNRIDSIVPI